ncbi:glycosyltransferase family 2 protein [Candidatus Babeliales bacterium]|nr:glycosyltransferase family 2 protein [Candidatus Babeliales bacterium]
MQTLSVVIPVYNEEENIHELYRRLKKVLTEDFSSFNYQILFVDDGSSDRTFQFISELRKNDQNIKIVQFSRNFGHHLAITAGLDHAEGDLIVTMDGDLQDQPEEMIKLYEKLQQDCDVVYGERQNKKFPFFKRACSKLFLTIIKLLVGEDIVINSHIFRIMTRQVVDQVKLCRETNRYVVGLIGWVGFKHDSIPVEHGRRFKGETKYSFSKLVRLALDAIFTFSDYPLKLIIRMGFFLVLFSFFCGSYFIFDYMFFGIKVPGWGSLIVSVLFMGGMQVFMIGLMGEYMGRMYMEVKKRPLYIVRRIVSK